MLTTIMLLLVVTQGIVFCELYLGRKRYLKDYNNQLHKNDFIRLRLKRLEDKTFGLILKHEEEGVFIGNRTCDRAEDRLLRIEKQIQRIQDSDKNTFDCSYEALMKSKKNTEDIKNILYKTKAIDEWIDKQAWEKLKKDKPNLTFFPIES